MVKDHSDSKRGNPLRPHGLLFPINSKVFYMYHPTDRIAHTTCRRTAFIHERAQQVGATCSSVVRVFAYGAMGRRIDSSWWTYLAIYRSSQCSTTGVTKTVLCAIMSVGMVHRKEPLLLIGKSSPCSGGSWFPLSLSEWFFTLCSTPYNRK